MQTVSACELRITTPEELIGAAHASCFAMAFVATLGRRGIHRDKFQNEAIVTAESQDSHRLLSLRDEFVGGRS
jgi:osmotically inducible protein OsmC